MVKAAKRRKKKKEEDADFSFPDFDEVEYMEKEIEGAKAVFVSIALAIPVAMLLFLLTVWGVPVVAFFTGIGVTFLLPRILPLVPWPKIDIQRFERRDWMGQGGTFLFSWLAIWILLLNAPFVDLTPPVIAQIMVNGDAIPLDQPDITWDRTGTDLTVNATILENVELDNVTFTINGSPYTPVSTPSIPALFSYTLVNASGVYTVIVSAIDGAGHSTSFRFLVNLSS